VTPFVELTVGLFLVEHHANGLRLGEIADAGGSSVGRLGAQPTAGQTSNRAFDVDGTDVRISGCVVVTIDKWPPNGSKPNRRRTGLPRAWVRPVRRYRRCI
jgi:hypothetical protein